MKPCPHPFRDLKLLVADVTQATCAAPIPIKAIDAKPGATDHVVGRWCGRCGCLTAGDVLYHPKARVIEDLA